MLMLLRLLLLVLLLAAQPALAAELLGQVVGIHDGDTLTLLTPENRQIRIRLAGIDAPESRQPYGTRAQQELSALSFRKQARVVVQDTDRYGRTVGTVWVDRLNVDAELVRRGAAWVYPQYNRDPALPPLKAEARQAQRGLWALGVNERQPPAPVQSRPVPTSSLSCDSKRYCTEMTSCAEAQFYFRQCGLDRLDDDNDGVPCERLCR
jgi:endonuclease YncB( thermonuclease family)